MIDKAAILDVLEERLPKLSVGHALDLRTYKRNRSVVIHKTGADELTFIEDGFARETVTAPVSKLRKVMKTLLKREFPRSTKIRLYDLGEYTPDKERLARKTI